MKTYKLSRSVIRVLRLHPSPQYKIALQAGIHPNTLSKLIHGALPIQKNDPRVIRLGAVLGLSSKNLLEAQREETLLARINEGSPGDDRYDLAEDELFKKNGGF
ncbi:hypothetical protein K1X76_01375 [bacterium]|nr:hypothetical protein [bacterium]